MPSFAAVCVLISTHEPHITLESGSGASCIHGRWASEPSYHICEANGKKWNGKSFASPSNCGAVYFLGGPSNFAAPIGAGLSSALHQPPWSCTFDQNSSASFATLLPCSL